MPQIEPKGKGVELRTNQVLRADNLISEQNNFLAFGCISGIFRAAHVVEGMLLHVECHYNTNAGAHVIHSQSDLHIYF